LPGEVCEGVDRVGSRRCVPAESQRRRANAENTLGELFQYAPRLRNTTRNVPQCRVSPVRSGPFISRRGAKTQSKDAEFNGEKIAGELRSIRAAASENYKHGADEDFEIQGHAPLADVLRVANDAAAIAQVVAPGDLPQSGHTGSHALI